ncbi:hypothetical protein KLK06_33075 [Nonomuraea sp. NEAU-A123]|nr:hypothetical protein [Nonomuraea sp. NEAU-A123]MBT2230685.1 hypothetical protein [Nonomuraea sp. NEAU-A123]
MVINDRDERPQFDDDEIRVALDLDSRVPLMRVDARSKNLVMNSLIELIKYAAVDVAGCLVGSTPLVEHGGQE